MQNKFQLEYWQDGDFLVGRLKGVPGVFSQGATLQELTENIRDAYRMMVEADEPPPVEIEPKYVEIDLAV